MTIPVWVLVGFAVWTLFILIATIGVYRWWHIFAGNAGVAEWRADGAQGAEWYRRAMRAHANCIENLPVYGALVVALVAGGIHDAWTDRLATAMLAFRVLHTTVHVTLAQTNRVATLRFSLFLVQVLCMLGIVGRILTLA